MSAPGRTGRSMNEGVSPASGAIPTPSPLGGVEHGYGAGWTLEQAMSELEAIVERVEGGEVGLEDALKEYERGVALVRRCREVLQRAEVRVEELGSLAAEPKGNGESSGSK